MVYDSVYEANNYLRSGVNISKDTTKDGTNSNITLDTTNEKLGTGCYDFNGSTSRSVTSVKFNGLHDNTGGSISFWMRPRNMSSIHGNGDIIFDSMATSAANGTGISIAIKNTSLLRVNFTTSSNQWFTDINSTTQFANNTWYHVVMTFGSNTVKLYINGSQEDTATFSNPNTNASNGNFVIGSHSTDPSSYGYYDGLLDDTGIWNRVITSSEVTSLYNSGTGALSSSISTTDFAGYYNYDAVTGGKLENETTTSYPDVRKQHFWDYFSGSKLTTPAGADTNTSQTTYNDVSGIGSFTGGWGSRFNAGHALVGQEIRSITVRMKIQGSLNIVNMTARLYGSTNSTLRATSTAVSSSGITTSFSSVTFTFPAGSRGTVQAGDHLMIVADSAVSSQGWNCQIKGSSPASGQHFTTWQGQSNAFTEQTYRDLWFSPIVSGSPAIPSRWTERSVTGSPTFGMNDSVDGGYVITTASTTNSSGMIDFNNKRQYSNTGSVCILTIQRIDDTMQVFGGFADNITQATTNTAWVLNDTNYSYYRLLTGNSSGATQTDTTTNIDKLLKVHKIECNSADVSLTIDGTLGINKTTNLPTNKLQPNFGGFTRNSSANQMRINYMECYNT